MTEIARQVALMFGYKLVVCNDAYMTRAYNKTMALYGGEFLVSSEVFADPETTAKTFSDFIVNELIK